MIIGVVSNFMIKNNLTSNISKISLFICVGYLVIMLLLSLLLFNSFLVVLLPLIVLGFIPVLWLAAIINYFSMRRKGVKYRNIIMLSTTLLMLIAIIGTFGYFARENNTDVEYPDFAFINPEYTPSGYVLINAHTDKKTITNTYRSEENPDKKTTFDVTETLSSTDDSLQDCSKHWSNCEKINESPAIYSYMFLGKPLYSYITTKGLSISVHTFDLQQDEIVKVLSSF